MTEHSETLPGLKVLGTFHILLCFNHFILYICRLKLLVQIDLENFFLGVSFKFFYQSSSICFRECLSGKQYTNHLPRMAIKINCSFLGIWYQSETS